MKRTFKYYLKLNKTQKQKLDQVLKVCHWLYNHLLEQYRTRDKNKQKQPSEIPWLLIIPVVLIITILIGLLVYQVKKRNK